MVLTPSRALKFTASSREGHYHWLMALSFLANPAGMPPQVPRVPELETNVVQNQTTQQPMVRPVTGTPINNAQMRNFSEPTKTLSLKASLASMVTHEDADLQPLPTQQNLPSQPHMRPLDDFDRQLRRRSNTGPSHFIPSLRSSRSIASIVRPNTGATNQRPGTAGEGAGTVRMTAFVDNAHRDDILDVPPLPPAPSFVPSEMVSPEPMMRSRRNSGLSTTILEKRRSGRVFGDDDVELPFGRI